MQYWSYKAVKSKSSLLSCHSESWILEKEDFPQPSHLFVRWENGLLGERGVDSAFPGCCGDHILVHWARCQLKIATQKIDGRSTNAIPHLSKNLCVGAFPPRKILAFKVVETTVCTSCWGTSTVAWGREFYCWLFQESSLVDTLMFQTTCWSHSVSREVCRGS